jgi:TRAP-type C4-dicarboxylate transport system permease small subunit
VLRRVLSHLASINETLCGAAKNLAGLLLIAMVVIVILQIIFRDVLNDSLIWSEELTKAMMVWTAFLVAPWAYRAGANVRIQIFIDELPPRLRMLLGLLLNLLILWIIGVFLFESLGFWERGLTVRADSLPIQVAWFYSVVPVALLLLLLVGIEHFLRNVLGLAYADENFELPPADDIF